jgi:hypothetical protein
MKTGSSLVILSEAKDRNSGCTAIGLAGSSYAIVIGAIFWSCDSAPLHAGVSR